MAAPGLCQSSPCYFWLTLHAPGSVGTDVGAGGGFQGRSWQRGLAAQRHSATTNANPGRANSGFLPSAVIQEQCNRMINSQSPKVAG